MTHKEKNPKSADVSLREKDKLIGKVSKTGEHVVEKNPLDTDQGALIIHFIY